MSSFFLICVTEGRYIESFAYVDVKVPKREIFDRSDFPDFYIIKSICVGDVGVKIKKF